MTRDEVLDQALKAIGPEVNWCECTGAIQALESKPPEKSPELTLESNPYDTNAMSHAELADLVFDLHRRWMGAHAQYVEERGAADFHAERAAGRLNENKALKRQAADLEAQLAKAKAQATEAQATADRTLWEVRGAPMKGEPSTPGASPLDGHAFAPSEAGANLCAVCGYPADYVELASGAPLHPGMRT